jgi:hypothetical protein
MIKLNRKRLLIGLIVACGIVALISILGIGYLVWDILSMYFRMKREAGG